MEAKLAMLKSKLKNKQEVENLYNQHSSFTDATKSEVFILKPIEKETPLDLNEDDTIS